MTPNNTYSSNSPVHHDDDYSLPGQQTTPVESQQRVEFPDTPRPSLTPTFTSNLFPSPPRKKRDQRNSPSPFSFNEELEENFWFTREEPDQIKRIMKTYSKKLQLKENLGKREPGQFVGEICRKLLDTGTPTHHLKTYDEIKTYRVTTCPMGQQFHHEFLFAALTEWNLDGEPVHIQILNTDEERTQVQDRVPQGCLVSYLYQFPIFQSQSEYEYKQSDHQLPFTHAGQLSSILAQSDKFFRGIKLAAGFKDTCTLSCDKEDVQDHKDDSPVHCDARVFSQLQIFVQDVLEEFCSEFIVTNDGIILGSEEEFDDEDCMTGCDQHLLQALTSPLAPMDCWAQDDVSMSTVIIASPCSSPELKARSPPNAHFVTCCSWFGGATRARSHSFSNDEDSEDEDESDDDSDESDEES